MKTPVNSLKTLLRMLLGLACCMAGQAFCVEKGAIDLSKIRQDARAYADARHEKVFAWLDGNLDPQTG